MISSVQYREKAIELRKQGWTYGEILKELPVAKSSLSLWFKNLELNEKGEKTLQSRRRLNISNGRVKAAASNKANRLQRQKTISESAEKELQKRRWDPLFLVGVALYWAQGSKNGTRAEFTNSDPKIIEAFLLWLEKFQELPREKLIYRVFVHGSSLNLDCIPLWAEELKVPLNSFKRTIYKPGAASSSNSLYKGCLKVTIPRSTNLLLKFKVWQNMLASSYTR